MAGLLKDDRFACQDEIQVRIVPDTRLLLTKIYQGKGKGCSDVIVKAISSIFFGNQKDSFGRMRLTKHMFDPITGRTIVTVATMIRHSIREYEYGEKRTIKFEGPGVDGK